MKVRRTTRWSGVLLALCATAGLPAVAWFPSEAHRAKEGSAEAGPEVISRDVRSPEGPIFVGATLYLVDYAAHNVVRLEQTSARIVWHRDGCGPTGLARVPEGRSTCRRRTIRTWRSRRTAPA